MEVFALPLVRYLPLTGSILNNKDPKNALLNKVMIPEIIQERKNWDHSAESCWLDGLPTASSEKAKESVKTTICPVVSEESWAKLNSAEQESLRVLMATSQVLSERVDILAKLAEQLQQQVDDFEEQHRRQEQENSDLAINPITPVKQH